MPLVLIFILLIVPVLAISHYFKKSSVQAVPLCLLGIAAFQYTLGLFNALIIGVWLLRGLWAVACAYLLYELLKKRLTIKWALVQTILPACLLAFCWWLCRGRSFSNWDEFSHWGIALKGLFYENVLPSVTSLRDGFKSYPPIIGVLQYSVARVVGLAFREDILLFIQAVLASSLLAYPIKAVSSALGKALLLPAMLIAPLILYPSFYYETTMDGFLGVAFAFILLAYLFSDKTRFDIALIAIASFVLCLVKTTGIIFVLFAVVIILTDTLLSCRKKGFTIKAFIPLIALSIGAAIAQCSWLLHLSLNNVAKRWADSSFSLEAMFNLVAKGEPQYRVDTLNNFCKNIFADFNYGSTIHFPYVVWTLLFAAVTVVLFCVARKLIPITALRISWLMCAAGALYTVLTLGSYLFAFSEYEAVNVASISRYLNTFLVAQTIITIALFGYILQATKLKRAAIFVAGYSAAWYLLVSPAPVTVIKNIITAPTAAAVTENSARVYEKAAAAMSAVTSGNPGRVRLISQFDYGYAHIRLAYHLAPLSFPDGFASITPDKEEKIDFWSEYHTLQTLQKQLYDNYDYVYIIYLNPAFTDNYSAIFENEADISEHALYKVNKENGEATLQLQEKIVL